MLFSITEKTVPIIEIKKLGTKFDDEWVHKDLDLTILPNRIIAVIGSSGCGKTTLVREILMLTPITHGEIYLFGEKIDSYNIESPKLRDILSKMGMMFQRGALFSSLTILENVMFPLLEYTKFSRNTIKEIAYLKLQLTGLSELAYHRYPTEISGGMLKRVALARTLALDPKVIFLDEPTAGLDPNSASAFDDLIAKLQKNLNLTVILITHDLDTIWNIANEVVYLGNKKVLYHDKIENVINSKIKEVNDYFNGSRGQIISNFYNR